MQEILKKAKERMKGFCRVCQVCDGRACAGEIPGMGGLGSGSSFVSNIRALQDIKFNMRVIHDIREPDTRINILGKSLSMPVLAAPIGGVEVNMGGGISESDYAHSILKGCQEQGILGCTGDGSMDMIFKTGCTAIKNNIGYGIPFIKPWEDQELFEKLAKAKETGATLVGMDIDAVGILTLKNMGRPVNPKPLEKLKHIIKQSDMRFILKGIMTREDAESAVEAGADAIVVSNHGGRVLDHTPGVAEVLPDISESVKGKITVLADGGIRTGADVLKMIALGADAVMIGRPFSIAAVGGLKDGVKKFINRIRTELIETMIMTGCPDVLSLPCSVLYRAE